MNNVEKAIIMAAGRGSRMQPLTDFTPKPLISVNGVKMIEGLIENLLLKRINDIVVVTGYLSEQFNYLQDKYGVKLILNRDYNIANNISSLYFAHNELNANLIIMDGDQIIKDTNVIKKRFKHSGYSCWYSNEYSNEWMLTLGARSRIQKCDRFGGKNAWELKSLSYWTRENAYKLASIVKQEYERGNKQIYWDDMVLFIHNSQFELYGHKIPKKSIIEIDSLEELITLDKKYNFKEREHVKKI